MNELTIQDIVIMNYSESLSQMKMFVNLAIQAGAVIIGGIALWRISNRIHKKRKDKRSRNSYFDTPYSKGWKRKQ